MTSLHGCPVKLASRVNGFPHPVSVGIMRILASAIAHAWSIIVANPGKHLPPATPNNPIEDCYTDALCNILAQMLLETDEIVPGYSGRLFAHVSRSENLPNFSAAKINKQPDLIVRLCNGPLIEARRFVGIYIEAKVVSAKARITLYTDDGLRRFIDGDYAWAMQGALMIAYQDPLQPRALATLEKKLAADTSLAVMSQGGQALAKPAGCGPVCGNSLHARSWAYLSGDLPGDIRVWHMWSLHMV